jgi:predicted metal-dependent peptidase
MDLNKALKDFFIREPFYGTLMLNFNKKLVDDDHPIKTAAVAVEGLSLTLYINKSFWDTLSDVQCRMLLKHEAMHCAFFHLTSLYNVPHGKNDLMNIAQDISINNYLESLPTDNGWTVDKLIETSHEDIKRNEGAWYYYKILDRLDEKIKDQIMQMLQDMKDKNKIDDHSMMSKKMSQAEAQLIENQIKSIIKNTVEQCKNKGNIPGELKDIIDSIMIKEEIFNWKKYFRRVLGNSIQSFIAPTKYRPSKRFPDAQGLKTKYKPEIFVAVDTSGSISDDEFNDFMSEIYHLYKAGVGVTIVQFDTKIQNIEQYKGKLDRIKRYGRGGTDISSTIEYYKSNIKKYSSCIIFTDGFLNINFKPCQQMVWVITKGGSKQDYPGKVIYIP